MVFASRLRSSVVCCSVSRLLLLDCYFHLAVLHLSRVTWLEAAWLSAVTCSSFACCVVPNESVSTTLAAVVSAFLWVFGEVSLLGDRRKTDESVSLPIINSSFGSRFVFN